MKRLLCVVLFVLAAISLAYAPGTAVKADDAKYWSYPLVPFEAGNPAKKYFAGSVEVKNLSTEKLQTFYFWFSRHPKQTMPADGIVALTYCCAPSEEVAVTVTSNRSREVRGYGETPWYRLILRKGELAPATIKTFKPPTAQLPLSDVKPLSGRTSDDGLLESGDLAHFSVPDISHYLYAGLREEKKEDEVVRGYYFFRKVQQETREQWVNVKMKHVSVFSYRYVPEKKRGASFASYPLIEVAEGYEKPWFGVYVFGITYRLQVPRGAIAPATVSEIFPPRELPDEEKSNRTDPPDTTKK